MGVVYKAEDDRLKRTVALKFLPIELTRDETAKKRLLREAQAISALQHHNICTIHEIDQRLTPRESACLLLRTEGFSHAEIATRLEIAAGTVGTLLTRAYRKVVSPAGSKPATAPG